jgi:hypothetical protein
VRTLKNLVLFALTLVAWVTIGISGTVREDLAGDPREAIQYSAILILSLAYLQWLLRRFLLPLDGVAKSRRQELLAKAKGAYWTGLSAWSIAFGYVHAALYVLSVLAHPEHIHDVPNTAVGAVFFIAGGTLLHVRMVTKALVAELGTQDGVARQEEEP